MATREIDPADLEHPAVYALLTALVVPRPIAWVSTLAADGTRNLAPHSYYNIVSSDPPVVHFTSAGDKDTLRNALATREFVVNVVDRALVEAMNLTSARFPPGEDEFAWAGLDAAPSTVVAPPRVAAAKAALECRLHAALTIGNGTMVLGEVVRVHLADGVEVDGAVDPARLAAVGRLGGSAYATTADVFRLDRPDWEDLRGRAGDGSPGAPGPPMGTDGA